ncbi:MAG TPA: DUF6776 family protein [Patescibacteria group bacterium]|nr:DUF6776 family protein [Patescibacteria group bacterium]
MPHAKGAGYNAPSPLRQRMKNPFKFHHTSMPLIVQTHDPARTRRIRIALVALWLVSLAATWAAASYLAAPGLFDMRQRLSQAESERDGVHDQLKDLQLKLSISERSDQVSRSANEVLQESLTSREEEIASLRADLAFYQRLMGGKAPRQGLTVQQLALRRIGVGNGYEMRATLTQNLRKGETTSGSASIRVEGVHEGELRALAWEALAQRKPEQAPAFSFKYFQELDVSFVLPEGFTPNRVVLVVKSAQGDQFERSFPWDQTLATGADEHVWK